MGVKDFLNRADKAVQDTKTTVSAAGILAACALVVAAVALVVAVRRQ